MRNERMKQIMDNCSKIRARRKKLTMEALQRQILLAQVKADLKHSGYKII